MLGRWGAQQPGRCACVSYGRCVLSCCPPPSVSFLHVGNTSGGLHCANPRPPTPSLCPCFHQQMDVVDCDFSRLCCCGKRNGSTITLFRCSPAATLFPLACVVGPHWPCIFFTSACIVIPSYFVIAYMCVTAEWAQ